jgi:hypothetical protein
MGQMMWARLKRWQRMRSGKWQWIEKEMLNLDEKERRLLEKEIQIW